MHVDELRTQVLRIPTDLPEADGTFAWDATTMVLVEAVAGSVRGIGWSYTAGAAAAVVHEVLEKAVVGRELDGVREAWERMVAAMRNIGRQGVAATAISAVDVALWDLAARLEGMPLTRLLGARRSSVPVYGSGGFTSYPMNVLIDQLTGWVEQGIPRVKMKIGVAGGTDDAEDRRRILAVRTRLGDGPELFVDANGAYTAGQAIRLARDLEGAASYFEEPVSSDHLGQLRDIRRAITQDVAAGEYGYDPWYFRAMLDAGAVDILQADATRCLGITGFLIAGSLAYAAGIPFSGHTSPTIHAHAGCAVPQLSHVEYFHDHARIESLLFEGLPELKGGMLHPPSDLPGLGVTLKQVEAAKFAVG